MSATFSKRSSNGLVSESVRRQKEVVCSGFFLHRGWNSLSVGKINLKVLGWRTRLTSLCCVSWLLPRKASFEIQHLCSCDYFATFFRLSLPCNAGEVSSKLTNRSGVRKILKMKDFLCCQNCKLICLFHLVVLQMKVQTSTKLRTTRAARSCSTFKKSNSCLCYFIMSSVESLSSHDGNGNDDARKQWSDWLNEERWSCSLHVRHAFLYNCLTYFAKWRREISKFKVLTTTCTHNSYCNSFILYI